MRGSAEDVEFLRRECVPVFAGVNELVTLFGGQVAHAADGAVDDLSAVGRQLPELLKELACILLLIGSEMLPGFHAAEHALLLRGRQAGKMLQPFPQAGLLLGRKAPELRIVFEGASLLSGRQIFVAAEPVSGVARLILWRACLVRMTFLLKVVPLPIGFWSRWGRPPNLGKGRSQQQRHCQTACKFSQARHPFSLILLG